MSTQNIGNRQSEADTLTVINQISGESVGPAKERDEGPAEVNQASDPAVLLNALREKERLVCLLEGCPDAKDIIAKKQELRDAINYLESII